MFKKCKTLMIGTALTLSVFASNVMAAATVEDIWTACDLTAIQGKLIAFFLLLVGAWTVVAAGRIVKKVISRSGSIG